MGGDEWWWLSSVASRGLQDQITQKESLNKDNMAFHSGLDRAFPMVDLKPDVQEII